MMTRGIQKTFLTIFSLIHLGMPLSAMAQSGPGEIPADVGYLPGTNLRSHDGRFRLYFQLDRNIVLFQGETASNVLWSSKTNVTGCDNLPGAPACTKPQVQEMRFQSDGNFVAYDQFGHGWGLSNTGGNPGSHMYIQDDGNMVIYNAAGRAIWSTKSCCH